MGVFLIFSAWNCMKNNKFKTLYLSDRDCSQIPYNWPELVNVIKHAIKSMERDECCQPIKPYVRFEDPSARIIALPARVGVGANSSAGIKWIASFPNNLSKGIPRAFSVSILNDSTTGFPLMIANSAILSIARTAAVSAVVTQKWLESCHQSHINIGLIGVGPIGKVHLEMFQVVLANRRGKIYVYDRDESALEKLQSSSNIEINICKDWREVQSNVDIFLTATTSSKGYIDEAPRKGALVLNVSLRDFSPVYRKFVDYLIVDNWSEVCREGTDIENMSKAGLSESDIVMLKDVVSKDCLDNRKKDEVVMLNPMGLAVFDVAIMKYYYEFALKSEGGKFLD